jgi:hypothetical protein
MLAVSSSAPGSGRGSVYLLRRMMLPHTSTVKHELSLALFKQERRFMKKKKNELSERDQAILTTAEKLKALDDVTLRMIDEKVGMIRQISEMYKKEILEREREIINQ